MDTYEGPVMSAAPPGPTRVGKYDPRRMLPQYEREPELTPSDVAKAGVQQFFNNLEPGEARDIVDLSSDPHPVLNNMRKRWPQYDDMDDETFITAVVKKYPSYADVEMDVKARKEKLYKQIDVIEFKKQNNLKLSTKELFIDKTVLPEDGERLGQQALLGFGNMASFGATEYILSKLGYSGIKPEGVGESAARGVGSLTGFVLSPLALSSKLLKATPGLNAMFMPKKATNIVTKMLWPMLRGGTTLGTANAMLIPAEAHKKGFIQLGDRVKEFGSGFMFGAGASGLGFIPNRAARMMSTSLFFGVPTTLQEASLEEQIFSYGLGAYSGFHSYKAMMENEKTARAVIDKGITDQRDLVKLKKTGNFLLEHTRTLIDKESTITTPTIDVGKKQYTPIGKAWRLDATKWIHKRIKQIKVGTNYKLRNDKTSRILTEIGEYGGIGKMTDAQIYNIREHLRPENTQPAPSSPFLHKPPPIPGAKSGKQMTMWHKMVRRGYTAMEKMGLGDFLEGGATGTVANSDVGRDVFHLNHRQITNVWKQIVGTNKQTARRLFQYLDGKLNLETLAKNHPKYEKELLVGNQMKTYFDYLLRIQNKNRLERGLKPVKGVDKYITHVFDGLKKQAIQEKYPFPDYISDQVELVPPKEANQPYLKSRRGLLGYKENVWSAMDAYAYRTGDYINDNGLRHINRIVKFLKAEISVNEHTGKESPIDLKGIKENLTDWSVRYTGQPGKIDHMFNAAIKKLPPEIRQHVGSIEKLSGIMRNLKYIGAMGWRPKLALRNLGQHSLILGEVGPKHLLKAIHNRKSPEARELLDNSLVLKTRELGFAPEIPQGLAIPGMETIRNSAFKMFKAADRVNVENAFLSGYFEMTKGKMVTKGSSLEKRAIDRGDKVAAMTQFMYTRGNRGPVSNLWGNSTAIGKTFSMFTTWPIDKVELMLAWGKSGQRHKLARYLAVVSGAALAAGIASNGKVRSSAYTGFGAETALLDKAMSGINLKDLINIPELALTNDVRRAMEDDELWKLLIYDIKDSSPLWESF